MDKRYMFKTIFLILSFETIQTLELQCKFSTVKCMVYKTGLWEDCFNCLVTNIHLNSPTTELTVNSRDNPKTMDKVIRVEISSSTLKYVPNKLIELFPSMTILYLQDNEGLTQLKPEYFKNMNNLLQLWFWNNQLTQIEGNMFAETPNLQVLGIQSNKITTIDKDAFKGLTKLETLFIFGNLFETLHKDTFKDNKELSWIHMSHGKLTNVPYALFSHLKNLNKLDLKSNICVDKLFTTVDTDLEQVLMDQCGQNKDIMAKKDQELFKALNDWKKSKTSLLKCKNDYINLEKHCATQKSKFEEYERRHCKKVAFTKRNGFQEQEEERLIFQ